MADGDYTTGCTISASYSSDVTVIGSAKARILCAALDFINASHIVIDGPSIEQIYTDKTASHLTFENLSVTCSDAAPYTLYAPDHLCDSFVMVSGTKNVTLTNMVVGPTYDSSSCGGNDGSKFLGYATVVATNVTWYDDRIPTIANCGGTHQHTENLMIDDLGPQNGGSVVLNRCHFTNGPKSGEYLGGGTYDGTGPDTSELFLDTGDPWSVDGKQGVGNVTIENCIFDGNGNQAIHADNHQVTPDLPNTLIENNTWLLPSTLDYTAYTTLTVRNNIGNDGLCMAAGGGTLKHNVFYDPASIGAAATCGDPSNVGVGLGGIAAIFENYPSNLTPSSSSVALDEGDPANYPATDYNGTARFCGAAPDAGAIERCP